MGNILMALNEIRRNKPYNISMLGDAANLLI